MKTVDDPINLYFQVKAKEFYLRYVTFYTRVLNCKQAIVHSLKITIVKSKLQWHVLVVNNVNVRMALFMLLNMSLTHDIKHAKINIGTLEKKPNDQQKASIGHEICQTKQTKVIKYVCLYLCCKAWLEQGNKWYRH